MGRAGVVGGIWFVLGSIPNGAGTMVLRCFLFLRGDLDGMDWTKVSS